MKKRFTLSLCLVILFVEIVKSQSTLAEVQLPPGKINNIQSYFIKDTILLSVDVSDPKFHVDAKRFYLLSPDGTSHEFSTTLIGNAPLCGLSRYEDGDYLYYLSGKRKDLTLKTFIYNKYSGQQKIAETEIEIDGTLIGSWQEGDLFLAVYNRISNELKIIRINKTEVKSEKVFSLPIDLAPYYKELTFIPESRFTSVDQGSAKFKLYKIKNELILTVDYTLAEMAPTSKTIVVRMNIDSGEQTKKEFKDNSLVYFRSFVSKDVLYMASVSKKEFRLRMNHLVTGALMGQKEIIRDTLFKEKFIYRRIGSDFRISKKETLFNMMKISVACLPSIVVTEEDSCTSSIIWGTYFNDKGVGSPVGMLTNPIAGIISMVATTAIMQMAEAPGISRYFYLQNSECNSPYQFSESKRITLRQSIDDYEISLDLKRIFSDYKGYFDYQDGGIGVYRGHRDAKNKLTLIKFDRKESSASN